METAIAVSVVVIPCPVSVVFPTKREWKPLILEDCQTKSEVSVVFPTKREWKPSQASSAEAEILSLSCLPDEEGMDVQEKSIRSG